MSKSTRKGELTTTGFALFFVMTVAGIIASVFSFGAVPIAIAAVGFLGLTYENILRPLLERVGFFRLLDGVGNFLSRSYNSMRKMGEGVSRSINEYLKSFQEYPDAIVLTDSPAPPALVQKVLESMVKSMGKIESNVLEISKLSNKALEDKEADVKSKVETIKNEVANLKTLLKGNNSKDPNLPFLDKIEKKLQEFLSKDPLDCAEMQSLRDTCLSLNQEENEKFEEFKQEHASHMLHGADLFLKDLSQSLYEHLPSAEIGGLRGAEYEPPIKSPDSRIAERVLSGLESLSRGHYENVMHALSRIESGSAGSSNGSGPASPDTLAVEKL